MRSSHLASASSAVNLYLSGSEAEGGGALDLDDEEEEGGGAFLGAADAGGGADFLTCQKRKAKREREGLVSKVEKRGRTRE